MFSFLSFLLNISGPKKSESKNRFSRPNGCLVHLGRLMDIIHMYELVAFATSTTSTPLGGGSAVREMPIHVIQVAHQQLLDVLGFFSMFCLRKKKKNGKKIRMSSSWFRCVRMFQTFAIWNGSFCLFPELIGFRVSFWLKLVCIIVCILKSCCVFEVLSILFPKVGIYMHCFRVGHSRKMDIGPVSFPDCFPTVWIFPQRIDSNKILSNRIFHLDFSCKLKN